MPIEEENRTTSATTSNDGTSLLNDDELKSIKNSAHLSQAEIINVLKQNIKTVLLDGEEVMVADRQTLIKLLGYLIANLDTNYIDVVLLEYITRLINLNKNKDKQSDKEKERTHKEELQLKARFAIYELYKKINPHQLAGETPLENFINNMRTRGINSAIRDTVDLKSILNLIVSLVSKFTGLEDMVKSSEIKQIINYHNNQSHDTGKAPPRNHTLNQLEEQLKPKSQERSI